MKNYLWVRLFLAAMMVLNLSACGGSGGGSSDSGSVPGTTVSGVVEDGPVAKATVYAQRKDGSGKIFGPCVTDEMGQFTLTVDAGVDLKDLMLFAKGGKDGTTGPTGLDFKGMTMMAPLEMFAGKTGAAVVSPATTLVGLLVAEGDGYDSACAKVADTLKVAEGMLGARPTVEGGEFHAKSMMLSLVAVVLHSEGGDTNAFDKVTFSNTGRAESNGNAELEKNLAVIEKALKEGKKPGDVFVRARLLMAMVDILDANSPSSQSSVATFATNADKLIDDILKATESKVISLESMAAERVVRWVLRNSGIDTYDLFMGDNFPMLTAWVEDSEDIASIVTLIASKYNVKEALFSGEVLGDDNAKRLDYYFQSDASHLFKAEKLIETVRDDTINDAILLQIAAGRAEAGFFNVSENILETKIFSTALRGVGYTTIGGTALKFSKRSSSITHEQAVGYLDKAEKLFKKKIESAGKAFFDAVDAGYIQSLVYQYRAAGEFTKADAMNAYAIECIDVMADSNPTALGRILVSMRDTSEDLIKDGNEVEAAKLPEMMVRLAEKIPGKASDDDNPGVIDDYRSRISGLSYAMAAYGALYTTFGGDDMYKNGAAAAYLKIKALRDANPYTLTKTWAVVADPIIPVLTVTGDLDEVNALLGVTPDKNKQAVYTAQATALAIAGKMSEAFAAVDKISTDGFWGIEGRVSALTYYAANDGVRWIAANLIDAGSSRYPDAKLALEKAESLVDGYTGSTRFQKLYVKIEWGYVKLARLFGEIGATEDQVRVLEKTETCIESDVSDIDDKIDMLCAIAPYWKQAGNTARFDRCMERARTLADSAAASGSEKPEDVADYYKTLMRGYMKLDKWDNVRELANILVDKSVLVFDESLSDDQWATGSFGKHDKLLTKRGENIYYAAGALIDSGYKDEAVTALDKAIGSKAVYYDDDEAVELCTGKDGSAYEGLVYMYGRADAVDKALAMSMDLELTAEVNNGIELIAFSLASRDRFPDKHTYSPDKPNHWVATIDTDGDGQPNFFHPLATDDDIAASGLTLDPDSDGDGTPDTEDTKPLFAN